MEYRYNHIWYFYLTLSKIVDVAFIKWIFLNVYFIFKFLEDVYMSVSVYVCAPE